MKIKSYMINFLRFLFLYKYYVIVIKCFDNVCCICDKDGKVDEEIEEMRLSTFFTNFFG